MAAQINFTDRRMDLYLIMGLGLGVPGPPQLYDLGGGGGGGGGHGPPGSYATAGTVFVLRIPFIRVHSRSFLF